jgi:AraC family transcriptional regulator of adaptative response/methylated-DNA-[protein]-cysteine methyltransferase
MTMRTIDTTASETLRFGYGDTALGTIVVAESMLGIAALFIGDDRAKLLRDLKDAFPGVEFVLDQTGLARTIAKAAALVAAPHVATDLDLALDLRGSSMELAVWDALRAIPVGETRSYGAIVRDLPLTRASRHFCDEVVDKPRDVGEST